MTAVSFDVVGDPKPQGSKAAFTDRAGNARLKESGNLAHARWRNQVAAAAREAAEHCPDAPLDGALLLEVDFRFAMPASRPKWHKARGVMPKTTAPDTSKLVRALEDGLQAGGLIADDARISTLIATKVEVHADWTGAIVRLSRDFGGEP